ncbi:serine acetyltransferase [soil metagenome]
MSATEPTAPPTHPGAGFTSVAQQLRDSLLDPDMPLNHLEEGVLPSRQAALQILSALKDVLFPDHRLDRTPRNEQTEEFLEEMLEKIHVDLRRQIFLARSYAYKGGGPCPYTLHQADGDARKILGRLPALREILGDDVDAALDGDPAAGSRDEIIFCYPGLEAIATYRIAHELHLLGIPLLPRIMTEHAHSVTGADIHPGAMIGRSFFIDHATGVVIGQTTIIGTGVRLYQGVTLGALRFVKDEQGNLVRGLKRHPTIEDDVVIYAGATVLGGETTIGRGAVIGGSCWITTSVPAGTTVLIPEPQMRLRGPKRDDAKSLELDWSI